jgi:putative ABC transport system ATP-binding protein
MSADGQTAQDEIILATEHLGRSVGSIALVSDVSVEIHSGELLAIAGPSGAGKSSFLRLLNRLDEPTSGVVSFEGVDYRQIAPRDLRRKVGMVMQRPFLFPGTVADNVRFGPRQRGEVLADETVDKILLQVGLPDFAPRNVANLSGGEAQRVSLARALANSPKVLLLDEPTSALDEESKSGIEALIQKIMSETRLTCVMVTHDVAQAARMAGRVMFLDRGRMVRIGTAAEVFLA